MGSLLRRQGGGHLGAGARRQHHPQEGVVFRTNRGQILLNDLDTGRVFDIALTGDVRIDTWPGGAPRSEPERWISPVQRDRPTPPTTTSTTKTG